MIESPPHPLCYTGKCTQHKETDMGKHVPLPSDPVAKAAEKKRRFKVYQKAWKIGARQHQRAQRNAKLAAAYIKQRDEDRAEAEARKAWRKARHYDLIGL